MSSVVALQPNSQPKRGKYDRPAKNETREFMFLELPRKVSILTLPSDAALCSVALEADQIIDKDTHQQWVERAPGVQRLHATLAKELGYNNVESSLGVLEEYIPTRKVDLINADMECSFTEKLGLAFENVFSNYLMEDADIILWLTGWARNPATRDFHKWFEDLVRNADPNDPLRREADRIASANGNQNPDPSVILPYVLMACALNRFTYEKSESREYADTRTTMVALGFSHIRPRQSPPVLPSFSSLVKAFREQNNRKYLTGVQRDLLAWLEDRLATFGMGIEFEDDHWWTLNKDKRTGGHFGSVEQVYNTFIPILGEKA